LSVLVVQREANDVAACERVGAYARTNVAPCRQAA